MVRMLGVVATCAGLMFATAPGSTQANGAVDYDVANGHFFSQTNGTSLGPHGGGYSITDADGAAFWTFFNAHGGVDLLGYPVSQRFVWDGYVCQATQRAILQWNPTTGEVQLANVFDFFSRVGKDDWLMASHLAPPPQQTTQEAIPRATPLPFIMLAHYRFGWLYADPALYHRYFNTPSYYAIYGLPTSPVVDLGPYKAIRTQRAVLYHWKFSVPWADDRGVSVGLAGDLFKELGLIPGAALQPEAGGSTLAVPSPAARHAPLVPAQVARTDGSGLPVLVGVATWYGADFQGQTMYDGEPYDMYNPGITAANLYPIGTLLKVTRLSTGQSIVVRVTDRGAFRYPDITDLSYAAFSQLGNPAIGMIGVRVEPVSDGG
jgi:rare lipoprotein A